MREVAEQIKTLADNNPCGWSEDVMLMVALALKALIALKTKVAMSKEQVARYIGVSPRTIQRMVQDGKLPKPHRFGFQNITFFADEIDEYLNKDRDPIHS